MLRHTLSSCAVSRRLMTLPVDAGTLHRHMGHAVAFEPVPQGEQLAGGGAERADMLLTFRPRTRDTHAGGHRLLVDIKAAAAFKYTLHRVTSPGRVHRRSQERPDHEFARRARWQQCGVPEAPTSIFFADSRYQNASTFPNARCAARIPVFILQGGRRAHDPFFLTPATAPVSTVRSRSRRVRARARSAVGRASPV